MITTIGPGTFPSIRSSNNPGELTLEGAQAAVGGYVQVLASRDGAVQLLLDDEGKLKGYPENPLATRLAHELGALAPDDVLVGVVVRLTAPHLWT